MEEIKKSKTKKIIKFLVDHIMVISAMIFLCVLLFSSCSTAKAAEYNESYTNWLIDKLEDAPNYNTFVNTSGITNILTDIQNNASAMFRGECLTAYNNTAYVVGVEVSGGFGWLLSPYQNDSGYSGLSFEIGFNASNKRLQGRRMISTSNSPFAYIFAFDNVTGDILYCSKYVNNYQATSSFTLTAYDLNTSLNNSTGTKTIYWIPSEGRVNISYVYNNSTSGNYAYRIPDYNFEVSDSNMVFAPNENLSWTGYFTSEFDVTPNYTEDNRLKIYSINDLSGSKSIVFDIDDFNFSNYSGNDAATQNTLYNNQISVTVDYDGTEQTFILDNTNSDILPAYLIETPYSFFNLGEYTNVKITKVEFSKLIHYMPSEMREDEIENYYISCEYYLKRPESAPEASDIPYNSDVDNTKITQLQINEKNEIINYNNGHYSPSGGGGEPLIVPDGYTVKLITVTGSDTLASILNDIYNGRYILNGLSGIYQFADDVVDYITGINTTDQFMEFMEDSIKNNNYSLLYDFVVYYWAPDASLGEPDVMYYYLTNSGKLRTINKTLADIWIESNQVSVNTGSLYDYLKERLDDFENQTLDQLYGNNKLVEESNEWLQTINNTLSNLSFSDPFDDSDLLDKLDYVISILDDIAGFFSGDSNEGYSKFTKWIEEIEDDGEITPHEWANDIFNYVTGLYHSLSDGTSYYTDDITDYINYVNQDGDSDPGNYFFAMYEDTYDPHNYYGWNGGLS